MKEGWEYNTLGELTISINGLWKGKKEPFVNVGVIRNANFTKDLTLDYSKIEYLDVELKQYKNRKLQKGDLIVEKSGGSEKQPVGRTVLFNEEGEFSVSNFTAILRINDRNIIKSEFLYKYLLYIYREGKTKEMQKATTGIHNIIFDKFLALSIPVPSLPEQQQIVEYLDAQFKRIDALKANAEQQLQAAKDLFQSALKDLLTPKEGWEEKTLGKVCKKTKNIKWTEDSGVYKYVDLSSVSREELRITNSIEIDYQDAPSRAKQIMATNDILFATTRPTLRRLCIVTSDFDNEICSTGFCVLRPNPVIHYNFLFYSLQTDRFYDYLEPLQTGANYPAVTDGVVKSYTFFAPTSLSEQEQIANELDDLSAKVKQLQDNYNETITLCNDLKQSLLKKIFE